MVYRILILIAIVFFLALLGYQVAASHKAEKEELKVPLGLPPIPWPEDNPYTKEKAELGRLLYFDKRLSSDQSISCASCHHRACGYGDCLPLAIGIHHTTGSRHSQSVINAAYHKVLFWDGRASSLEEQCKGPLGNPKEMTSYKNPHEAHEQCVEKVREIGGYKILFKKAFGDEEITIDNIAKAIATFERTILSGNSPYDRYAAGDRAALSEEQLKGMRLFKKVGCVNCHGGFNFTDERFHNIGIGMDAKEPDLGRYVITHQERDWGAFKSPTLRESEHAAPYMHDGSLATLEEVIDYYDKGGVKNKGLSPLMRPLNLSSEDKRALVSFLKALSGEGWQQIAEPKTFPQ